MSSPTGGRRRTTSRQYSAEDQALNQIAKEAEGRLAARRQARAEARDIRMRELERQQREAEEKKDRHYELTKDSSTRSNRNNFSSVNSSRRGSDESTEDTRELRKEVMELEEKYKKAMLNNASLDNEKQSYRYQVDLLKDNSEEMEESFLELQREHKDRCRELDHAKRDIKDLSRQMEFVKEQLMQRDKLIEEHGLVFVSNETVETKEDNSKKKKKKKDGKKEEKTAALVTPEAARILEVTGEGSLDDTIKKFSEEKERLEAENKKLHQLLEDEKERCALAEKYASPKSSGPKVNGPDMQLLEIQNELSAMEAQKQINDYKFKLKKAEQDITQLEGNAIRLESQVKRYKTSAENSEKQEEELKQEKRKLQKELREAQNLVEELQTSNHHLNKRLEKIKASRNAISKQ